MKSKKNLIFSVITIILILTTIILFHVFEKNEEPAPLTNSESETTDSEIAVPQENSEPRADRDTAVTGELEGPENLTDQEDAEDKKIIEAIRDLNSHFPTFIDYFSDTSIVIDWDSIKLPCSYSVFESIGWSWNFETDSEKEIGSGEQYTANLTNGKISSSDLNFYVTFKNETEEDQLLSDCTLFQITIIANNSSDSVKSIILPAGLVIGDTIDTAKSFYGTPQSETENSVVYEDTESGLYISLADKAGFGINEVVISQLK